MDILRLGPPNGGAECRGMNETKQDTAIISIEYE